MFLSDRKARPWTVPGGGKGSFTADGYYLGQGGRTPLEVAVARAPSRPTESDVRSLWKRRKGNQPSPLLLVVLWPSKDGNRASVCGSVGDDPPVYSDRDRGQVARLAALALGEPDHHSATRLLASYLPEEAGGLRNVSLFASYHMAERIPRRPDWDELCKRGVELLGLRRERLLEALGFSLDAKGPAAVLRSSTGHARALAVFLDDTENPDITSSRFNGITPVSWAIAFATAENIPYVMLTRGPQIRVYTTRVGAGTTGKGGTSAFVELTLPLLTGKDAGYLPLLFGAESLADGGLFETVLAESHDFAAGVGTRLRSRVYDFAVPAIAQALIRRHEAAGGETDERALADLYDRALLVLFRLLFVAYAEDRDLLPLRSNGLYRQRSLKHVARGLAQLANSHESGKVPFDPHATDLWDTVRALWTAIDKGRPEWSVPVYNGGMFSSEAEVNGRGAALAQVQITNAEFGPALMGLLLDPSDSGEWGPVDFAGLDVREFGTIYEGLLESGLAVASTDLRLKGGTGKDADAYVPAGPDQDVKVPAGRVYLHNRSGARKDSGAYFTRPFAVAHLLDKALEPVLERHLARLRDLLEADREVDAAEAFFDLRVVDLAMGSGHFLVAAVDRIERRLSEFLVHHRVQGVLDELARVGAEADKNLVEAGLPADGVDTSALLRRQIARRCIYGIDLNPTAVELARLALWIHSFVRGLPLANLHHGLVSGDSITGMSSVAEAVTLLKPPRKATKDGDAASHQVSFLEEAINTAAGNAGEALRRFAKTSEATKAEILAARAAYEEARAAIEPARLLFDFALAIRVGRAPVPINELTVEGVLEAARAPEVARATREMRPLHFPAAFSEVFFRDDPGFDCIIGNPPWEKLKFEPQAFWVTRFPGLNALSDEKREQELDKLRVQYPEDAAEEAVQQARRETLQALVKETYSLLGVGHYDFAKIFVERAVDLTRQTGAIGYVLPRSALVLGGWGKLRQAFLEGHAVATVQARNKGGWLFDNVHNSYMVTLASRQPIGSSEEERVLIWPDVSGPEEVATLSEAHAVTLTGDEVRDLSDTYVVPWFNTAQDRALFDKLRNRTRLAKQGGWITGVHDARWDFRAAGPNKSSAANNKSGYGWRVLMTRHVDAFHIDRDDKLFQKWVADPGALGKGIDIGPDGEPYLGSSHPLIVVRHPSRNDDSRTMIASALARSGELHAKGYIHAVAHQPGTAPRDLLALLVLLNTYTCDWWLRRFVDRHVTAPVVNNIPLPDWADANRSAAATIAATLLARGGTTRLAGDIVAEETSEHEGRSDIDLLVDAELLVLRGFDLVRDDARMILTDFAEKRDACPTAFRVALMEKMER